MHKWWHSTHTYTSTHAAGASAATAIVVRARLISEGRDTNGSFHLHMFTHAVILLHISSRIDETYADMTCVSFNYLAIIARICRVHISHTQYAHVTRATAVSKTTNWLISGSWRLLFHIDEAEHNNSHSKFLIAQQNVLRAYCVYCIIKITIICHVVPISNRRKTYKSSCIHRYVDVH